MTDYSNLMKRLRRLVGQEGIGPVALALLARDAADALEALEKRMAEEKLAHERWRDEWQKSQQKLAAAEREHDELLTLRHQFAEENSRLFAERTALRRERDEAVALLRAETVGEPYWCECRDAFLDKVMLDTSPTQDSADAAPNSHHE